MRVSREVSGRRRPRLASLRRQPGAALRPPAAENGLACACAHTLAEPVRLLPLPRIRLVCPLHEASSSVVGRHARRPRGALRRGRRVYQSDAPTTRRACADDDPEPRPGTHPLPAPRAERPQLWKVLWRDFFPCSSPFPGTKTRPPHDALRKFCRTHDTFLSTGPHGPFGRGEGVVRSPTSRPE